MKKKYIFTLLLFVFSINAKAQIENEIKNFVDSTEILMNNGRKYIVQSLKENSPEKIKKIYHFLITKGEEDNCESFTLKEKLLILTVLQDWNGLLYEIEFYSPELHYQCYQNMTNIEDQLYNTLKKKMSDIYSDFYKQEFNSENKALLEILIHIEQYGSQNDEYDSLIKKFKKDFPNTKYSKFVRNYLPESKYRASFSISVGPKLSYYSGEFKNYFNNPTAFSFTMDFCFPKVYVSLYMEGGVHQLKIPVTLTNKWNDSHSFEKGNSFSRLDVGLKTGYYIVRSKNIHIAPYATLLAGGFMDSNLYNSNSNNSSDDNPDKEFYIYDSFTFGGGVHLEQKLWTIKEKYYNQYYPYVNSNNIGGYISLKLDLGYAAIPSFTYLPAKGNMTYATLGLVWGIGEF